MDISGAFDHIFQQVRGELKSAFPAESWWSAIQGFYHAVNWREPWIMALLTFDATVLLATIATRKSWQAQRIIFFVTGKMRFRTCRDVFQAFVPGYGQIEMPEDLSRS